MTLCRRVLVGDLMVRLYPYIKDSNNLIWLNGAIFQYRNTEAQVIETYGKRKIAIRVRGTHEQKLATIITEAIDRSNESYENIKVKKLIPCNCKDCEGLGKKRHFYKHENLIRRMEWGINEIDL